MSTYPIPFSAINVANASLVNALLFVFTKIFSETTFSSGASKDLRKIVADPTSGITTRGTHSHKVWIAKNEEV